MYQQTTATKRVANLSKRIRAVQGGTSASKTVSILIYLIALAQSDKRVTLTSIVAESFPHLRRGAMRDFLLIMETHGYFKDARWDKTNSVYTFETGSQIEFFSVDQPEKVRGARRDRLFINECNNTSFEAFEELEVRTKDFIFLDWNPTNEFWFYQFVKSREDCEHIILTYLDNEALDPNIKASIESRRNRKGWWKVYGEGQLGEVEGKIYRDWKVWEGDIPHEARLERYGLDFGYSNDPTAIVAVYKHNGGYILDEITYLKGLQNNQIADILLNDSRALVVADSAEPKSIDELKTYGLGVIGARKGKDSIRHGINIVQQQRISYTRRSANIAREYRNYLWMTDKNGALISPNEPEAGFDHTMDAIRYAIVSMLDYLPDEVVQAQAEHFNRVINRGHLNSSK
jgi:phage terminase large subunit